MNWNFTSEDILNGSAECSIGVFRAALKADVVSQFEDKDSDEAENLFHLIYDICYWLATDATLTDLIEFYGGSEADIQLLNIIESRYRESIGILRAIIQIRYASGVDAGLTQAEALSYLMSS